MPFGAIAGAIGSVVGGLNQSSAIGDASKASTRAAELAAQLQYQQYADTANKLLPFLNTGTTANQVLSSNYFGINGPDGTFNPNAPFLQPISAQIGGPPSPTGNLAPPNPSDPRLAAEFQQSPGYAFNVREAMNAIQNSAAGRTGAVSGNMFRALQDRAAGLASNDYGNWYNNLVNSWQNLWTANNQNYTQNYNDVNTQRNRIIGVLQNLASGGAQAGTNTGQFGQQAVSNIGANLGTAAAAQGAGAIGQANTLSGLFQNPQLQTGISNGLNYLFGNSGSNPAAIASTYAGAYGNSLPYDLQQSY